MVFILCFYELEIFIQSKLCLIRHDGRIKRGQTLWGKIEMAGKTRALSRQRLRLSLRILELFGYAGINDLWILYDAEQEERR
jgi:hypothetical protein